MEANVTGRQYFVLILILGLMTALGPFSIDMYLSGYQAIAADMHTTSASIGLSLASYFIGISAGQLLYGPLLDRFGRKKPLYIGLVVYILASLGCIAAHTLGAFVVVRFIQAIGSCAATVASVAMVRDLFPIKDSAKVFALLMLVVGASPMIAPTVGGYVTVAWGWQSVFIILTLLGAMVLAACIFFLPESHQPDPSISLKPGPIINGFLEVIREPQFATYALTGAWAFAGLFVYVSASPVIFIDIFHVSKETFGWIFAGLSVGFIGSNQLNSLVLRKYRSDQIIGPALLGQAIAGAIFFIGTYYGWFGITGTIIMLFLYLSGLGFAYPNAAALSIAPFKRNAGSAAALMGALQMGIGGLASTFSSLLSKDNPMPMVTIMAGCAILSCVILAGGRTRITNPVLLQDGGDAVVVH
ncbi:multidrug effflux MFS transporter [Chitinophaga tropicalis]|uniref:Bcr/CflA family efflux MFS transporter n=1 Tax=Chitinophaga tropicalis TaxID=2683588 RepID=A0A7K1U5E9_9BACT|nr:multidrug effflux MFS transporter [Chitinophaga tropicalis]MVT09588.1 Bcr/CflA family efflux MFS transporter [Chitinophaga tropicalis]